MVFKYESYWPRGATKVLQVLSLSLLLRVVAMCCQLVWLWLYGVKPGFGGFLDWQKVAFLLDTIPWDSQSPPSEFLLYIFMQNSYSILSKIWIIGLDYTLSYYNGTNYNFSLHYGTQDVEFISLSKFMCIILFLIKIHETIN